MMNRWLLFSTCAVLGLVSLVCGFLVPMHLRAVDASVLRIAGRNTPSLVAKGQDLAREKKIGAAQMLLEAAELQSVPDTAKLASAIRDIAAQQPPVRTWGRAEPQFDGIFKSAALKSAHGSEPFTEIIVQTENREKALEFLGTVRRFDVQSVLRSRSLTNTAIFPSSLSASGQAMDAAVSICGLLLQGGHLKSTLGEGITALAVEANNGGSSQRFEQALLDLMSMGQRFDWGQLCEFTSQIDDVETLRLLAHQVRQGGDRLPILYSAVVISAKPASVTKYLMTYSQTGMQSLAASLQFGTGGINELLLRNQQVARPGFSHKLASFGPLRMFFLAAADWSFRSPWFALGLKFFFYLSSGFLVAFGLHFARPAVSDLEKPLQVRGFHVFREILFALGFLLVVLLLSEPFLAQESQRVEFPFRLRVPTVGSVVPAGPASAHPLIMNQLSLLTLLLFFVLQALIYTACLVKLAEIRRQKVAARVKLKLLENEEHLFDAGLYLGFVGTIVSLILVSLGVISFSLMAAYSSTSFGIIFVSIFKIFNLRPVRRKLVLEVEETNADPATQASAQPATTT